MNDLPKYQQLKKGKHTFACPCGQIIGEQVDNEGKVKPESQLYYWRIKEENPTKFKFACNSCKETYEQNEVMDHE